MDIAFEKKIRERAYAFWLAGGMAEGDAERHWLHAEAAVRREMPRTAQPTAAKAEPAAAKSARAKKAPASPVGTKTTKTAFSKSTKATSAKKVKAGGATAEAAL